jgi:hypothetical protein
MTQRSCAPNPEEALIAQMLRLASRAGFSPGEQEDLRDAISLWLPRFFRRSEALSSEPAAVELALLKLVADYARRVRIELAEG